MPVELSKRALPISRFAASLPGCGKAALAMVAMTLSVLKSTTDTSREFSLAT